jgi:two-component system, OmpR family, phosphate regulon sensor histidine kinase PhoR
MPAIYIELWLIPVVLLLLLIGGWGLYRLGGLRLTRPWRAALAHLPIGVLLFSATGQRRFANSAAEVLLQQIDRSALEHLVTAGRSGVHQSAMIGGRDGALVQAQAWPLGNPLGVVVTLRDASTQQTAITNYRKFIHTISHELLTPLTAIQGHLRHIAASDRADEGAWIGSLQVVGDEVDRLTRLTSNLLILSRLESGQPVTRRVTNLVALVEEVVLQLIEKADARGMTITVDANPRLARPTIDRDAWKQVLLNLIDNAIKYGNTGGTITVSLNQDETRLVLAVIDDGPGIAPDDIPHVFTELFRVEEQRKVSGTGLGLAIVRRIVEQHGGTITCSSEVGRYTSFLISLPLNPDIVTTS